MSGAVLASALRDTASRPEGLWLPARGRSMGRAIGSGAEVHVRAVAAEPAPGEVWAFCTPGGAVLVHRCRRAGPPHRFRGDARGGDDAPVEGALVIGRADRVRDGAGERPVPPHAPVDRARAGLVRSGETVRDQAVRVLRGVRRRVRSRR